MVSGFYLKLQLWFINDHCGHLHFLTFDPFVDINDVEISRDQLRLPTSLNQSRKILLGSDVVSKGRKGKRKKGGEDRG